MQHLFKSIGVVSIVALTLMAAVAESYAQTSYSSNMPMPPFA
jgi:hypothetical protein